MRDSFLNEQIDTPKMRSAIKQLQNAIANVPDWERCLYSAKAIGG